MTIGSTGSLTPMSLLKQRYRILQVIGTGGFAAVYKAEDTALGNRPVAVKEMSQQLLKAQELADAAAAFQREALMLANLNSPHLPHIYDYFGDNGHSYLVMDFIEGQTLEDYVAQHSGPLPLKELLILGIQLCTVLNYLHTRQPPVIFRDLKPANIMRTREGHLFLIDFGIARHFKPGQFRDTVALGSPGYAAPEQYGRAQSTPQTDIYSLGALLHFLLSGNDPADNPFQFTPLKPPVPLELNTLIMQMLAINASQRPASVAVIKEQLERLAIQEAAPQQQTSASALQPQASLKPRIQTPKQKPPPPRRRNVADQVTAIAWSPDAARIAVASIDGTIQLLDALTGNILGSYRKYVASSMLPMGYVACWSPAGKLLASGGDGATILIWHAGTGRTEVSYTNHTGNIRAIQWSPVGNTIASLDSSGTIRLWEAATGKTLFTKQDLGSRTYTISWSPDGTYLASEKDKASFWSGSKAVIEVWHTRTGKNMCEHQVDIDAVSSISWSPDGTLIASAGRFDKGVSIWDALTGKTLATHRHHTQHGLEVSWLPYKDLLISVDQLYKVVVWNYRKEELVAMYYAYDSDTRLIRPKAWSPDGQQLAFVTDEGKIQVWSLPHRAWES